MRGRNESHGWWHAAPLALALLACGGDGPVEPSRQPEPPTPSGPPSSAVSVVMVSGDGQVGPLGAPLAAPFVVRVTDARGDGVGNVEVTWRVVSGAGGLSYWNDQRAEPGPVTMLTTTAGIAVSRFTPWIPGSSAVTAEVAGPDGSRVAFTAEGTPLGWPPVSASALTYERVEHTAEALAYHRTLSERYVLGEDGTFRLQSLRGRSGFSEYRGTYSRAGSVLELAFEGWSLAGRWHATGTLEGSDCLVVEYNLVMLLSDFEDGRYCRPAATP